MESSRSASLSECEKELKNEEIAFLRENLKDIDIQDEYCTGFFTGEQKEFEDFIDNLQLINSTSFVRSECHSKEKGHKRLSKTASPVLEDKRGNIPIKLFGNPFTIISNESRHCLHGSSKTDARLKQKAVPEHDYSKKSRLHLQSTRKLGCLATIQVRCILVFKEFSVDVARCKSVRVFKEERAKTLKKLTDILEENPSHPFATERRYYVRLPLSSAHCGHPVGQCSSLGLHIDKRIVHKIYDLVKSNVTRVAEVRSSLERYVEEDLFRGVPKSKKPNKSNRRYFPKRRDLRNYIAKAIKSFRYSSDDQESLKKKIADWETQSPDTKFFYRTRNATTSSAEASETPDAEQSFLFVHQEPWQQRLLLRYGSDLVFMDATYKTTKYAIPLFFVCVQTNVGYKVVAEFMVQSEDQTSISEALHILKQWNPAWKPKYGMVDYSRAEINALEEQFPGITVYICDFHRIQSMQRWARSGNNGLSLTEQDLFLSHMQRITYASSRHEYDKAVASFRSSSMYKFRANVKKYVENTWLSCSFRWAQVFRKSEAIRIANTNNGVEAQNRLFKYDYLPRSIDKSVYGIAVVLVESFLPESYQQYHDTNLKLSSCYRKYSSTVPSYLQNRPPAFLKHCLKSKYDAAEYREEDVKPVNIKNGVFSVKSLTDPKKVTHEIDMKAPSCTCEAWKKTRFPCKHFFLVFSVYAEWNFDSLPESYRNNVFITLDDASFSKTATNDEKPAAEDNSSSPPSVNDDLEHVPCSPLSNENPREEGNDKAQKPGKLSKSPSVTKLKKKLQERIEALRSTAFLVQDYEVLKQAIDEVQNLQDLMMKSCPSLNGLPLRGSPEKKRLKETNVEYHQVFHKKLPQRKKWKKKQQKLAETPIVIDISDESEDGASAPSEEHKTTIQNDREEKSDVDIENEGEMTVGQQERKEGENCKGEDHDDLDSDVPLQPENRAVDPIIRLTNASRCGLQTSDAMLTFGEVKLTVGDLYSIVHPNEVKQLKPNERPRRFVPGWLTDTVIEATLWKLRLDYEDIFAADATMCKVVQAGASTRRLWSGEDFHNVKKILIPMNVNGQHWTLLVLDSSQKVRYYFDPLQGEAERQIDVQSEPRLASLINKLSAVADIKTGWDSISWKCLEPIHFQQQDNYNCGVLICIFARCVCNGNNLNNGFNLFTERQEMLSSIFGACYDDVLERNVNVCKVCRSDDDEDDWLGCDACGQWFHASCLNVDYAEIMASHFRCP